MAAPKVAPPPSVSPLAGTGDGPIQDFNFKLSKKIAQLTKVVYHLFTKHEDHELEIQRVSVFYEDEIDAVARDAAKKVEDIAAKLKEQTDQVERLKRENAEEKSRAFALVEEIKRKSAQRDSEVGLAAQRSVSALTRQVEEMRTQFAEKVEAFTSALAQNDRTHASEMDTLRRQQELQLKEAIESEVGRRMAELSEHKSDWQQQLEAMRKAAKDELDGVSREREAVYNDFRAASGLWAKQEDALKATVASLEAQLRDTQAALAAREQDLRNLEFSRGALEETLGSTSQLLRDEITRLKADLQDAGIKAGDMIAALGREQTRYAEAAAQMAAQEKTIVELEDSLRRSALELEKQAQLIASLRQDLDDVSSGKSQLLEQSSAEMQSLERRLRAEIERLEREQAEQKAEMERAHAAALQALLDDADAKRRAAEDDFDRRLREARSEAEARLREQQSSSAAALTEREEQLRQAVSRLEAQLRDEQERSAQKTSEYEASIRTLREEHARALQAKEAELVAARQETERLRNELSELQTRLSSSSAASGESLATAGREIEGLKRNLADLNASIEQLKSQHEAALRDQAERLTVEWTDRLAASEVALRTQQVRELEELKQAAELLEREKSAVIHQLRSEIDTLTDRLRGLQDMLAAQQDSAEAARETNSNQLNQLKEHHREQLEALARQHEVRLSMLRTELEAQHSRRLDELVEQHNAALSSLRLESERALQEQRDAADGELQGLRTQKDTELEALRSSLQGQIDALKQEAESMRRQFEMEQAAANAEYADASRAAAEGAAQLSKELERRQTKLDNLQMDLDRTRQVLERTEAELRTRTDELRSATADARDQLAKREAALKAERESALAARDREHQAELERRESTFAAERDRLNDVINEGRQGVKALKDRLAELQKRFEAREPRPEDVKRIKELERQVGRLTEDNQQLEEKMKVARLELQNREQSYNKMFSANPKVGVMNSTAMLQNTGAKPKPAAGAPSARSGSVSLPPLPSPGSSPRNGSMH